MDKVFQGNSKGISHHYIVDGNNTAIIHHLDPTLDVKNDQLHIVHAHPACIQAHIHYSQIGKQKRLYCGPHVVCAAPIQV